MKTKKHEAEAAQKAYEAYVDYAGNMSLVTGHELPIWNDLKSSIKHAWNSAAKAAGNIYIKNENDKI